MEIDTGCRDRQLPVPLIYVWHTTWSFGNLQPTKKRTDRLQPICSQFSEVVLIPSQPIGWS